MSEQPRTYINGTCQVGQSKPCGLPAAGAIAVTGVKDYAWAEETREGGVVLLCVEHYETPMDRWHELNALPATTPTPDGDPA